MTKVLFVILSSITLLACKGDGIPEGIITPREMELILWDLLRTDQVISIKYSTDTTVNRAVKSRQMYQQVLSIHKVSEADFKKSFAFYQSSPAALKPVLDSLRKKSPDLTAPLIK